MEKVDYSIIFLTIIFAKYYYWYMHLSERNIKVINNTMRPGPNSIYIYIHNKYIGFTNKFSIMLTASRKMLELLKHLI